MDRLKFQMAECSNPPQDLGPIKDTVLVVSFPVVVFYDAADKPAIVFPPTSNLGSVRNIDTLTSASGLQGH